MKERTEKKKINEKKENQNEGGGEQAGPYEEIKFSHFSNQEAFFT